MLVLLRPWTTFPRSTSPHPPHSFSFGPRTPDACWRGARLRGTQSVLRQRASRLELWEIEALLPQMETSVKDRRGAAEPREADGNGFGVGGIWG